MKIVWTPEALEDFDQNIRFLEMRFNETVVLSFISKSNQIFEIIKHKPETFQAANFKNTRSVPITKHIKLYYLVADDRIILLRFWNNYQNPVKLNV